MAPWSLSSLGAPELSAASVGVLVGALALGLGGAAAARRPQSWPLKAALGGALLCWAEAAAAALYPRPLDPAVAPVELLALSVGLAALLGLAARSAPVTAALLGALGAVFGPELCRAAGLGALALPLGLPLGLGLAALAHPRVRRFAPALLAVIGVSGPIVRALAPAPGAPAEAQVARPLLLITVDTVRADDGLLDDPAFAAEAGVWSSAEAVAAAPWTLPAMLSLSWAAPVSDHLGGLVGPLGPTLPAGGHPPPVRRGGLALLSNPWLAAERGFGDRMEHVLHVNDAREPLTLVQNIDGAWARVTGAPPRRWRGGESADAAVEAAALRALAAGQPFIWAHLLAPHEHRRGCVGAPAAGDCSEAAVRERHAALVAVTRARLLRLMAASADRITVVVGDHGEAFGEGGHQGHGLAFQDAELLVPLAIRLPGQHGGRLGGPIAVAELGGWLQAVMDGAPLLPGAPLRPARGGAVPVAGLRTGGGEAAVRVAPGRYAPGLELPVDGPSPPLDPAVQQQLRLLGYVEAL